MIKIKVVLCFQSLLVLLLSLTIYTSAKEPEEQYGAVCDVTQNEACFSNNTFDALACQPGFHVNNNYTNCTKDRRCCPCPPYTYQPWWNECNSCILCTDCMELNKETLNYCNITHNSVCGKELFSTSTPTVAVQTPQPTTVPTDTPTTPLMEESTKESPEPPDDPTTDDEPIEPVCSCPSSLIQAIVTHVVCFLVPLIIFLRYPDVARNVHDKIKSFFSKAMACLTSSNNNQKTGSAHYDAVGRSD